MIDGAKISCFLYAGYPICLFFSLFSTGFRISICLSVKIALVLSKLNLPTLSNLISMFLET